MSTIIYVATHKDYTFHSDDIEMPVQAGAAIHEKLPYGSDADGSNISNKNSNYCELTVLYWAWKNSDADQIGLCHYRRYFSGTKGIATGEEIREKMKGADVLLPKKRNYFIETNYSQYVHAHHEEDLIQTKQILSEKYPEYLPSWEKIMKKTAGHRFNMMVMKKQVLDRYCSWLFDILFELERRLDISDYSQNDARVFGFVSERLLDIWLDQQKDISVIEMPVHETEKVNWIKKGTAFLLRKIKGSL
ncbi:MAG: DUF4422 domain-containing protein [Oscillospiraceae bacterium]|nr:DUF4422 domain-containing protein [Oscillospiraceae bacterium]